jgi:pimeloyl-ACP methyl ester carboxylesterase
VPATTLTVGEARLEYWDRGAGLPLLFIHGVVTSGDIWNEDLAELASEFRLITYNRRGYGASSTSPREWSAHAQDAIALIGSLEAAPTIIVGYSGGAIVALNVALSRPELVAGLVLLDPAVNLKRCLTLDLLYTLAKVKALRWLKGERAAGESWLRYVSSYSTGGSAYEQRTTAERRQRLLSNTAGLFADFASSGSEISEDRLAAIALPVTIIDAALSPESLRRSSMRLRRLFPRANTVTLQGSGHWLALDSRAELLRVLRTAARSLAGVSTPGDSANPADRGCLS